MGVSMPPSMHDGMGGMGAHPASTIAPVGTKRKIPEDAETTAALYGDLPESKRRKFILVEDAQRSTRVRVRVQLDQIEINDLPDSFRKQTSVYARAYFPRQMQDPSEAPRNPRYFVGDEDDGNAEQSTVGKTLVPIPMLEGQKLALPRISRAKRKKEDTLNEMGYRMSWSQGRVFAGRVLFLQKSCKYASMLCLG